jgi:hypothetical protein
VVWFTQPPENAEHDDPALPSLKAAQEAAPGPVRCVRRETWLAVRNYIRIFGSKKLRPTTGLMAVAMEMEFPPHFLWLTGFDATTPDQPGWGDHNGEVTGQWRIRETHDHLTEKRVLAELVDKGLWLGKPVDTEAMWLGRPKGV